MDEPICFFLQVIPTTGFLTSKQVDSSTLFSPNFSKTFAARFINSIADQTLYKTLLYYGI